MLASQTSCIGCGILQVIIRSGSCNPKLNHQHTPVRNRELTARQKEILGTALAQGYFEFPRKLSLTGLSKLVGVKPSTLSEILRSAERKALESIVRAPAHRRSSRVS